VRAQLEAGAGDHLDLLSVQLESASARLAELDNEEKLQTSLDALEDALQEPADALAKVMASMPAKM
jgi:outer membrane protein TolC